MAKKQSTLSIIDSYKALPLGKYVGEILPICRQEGLDDLIRQVRIIGVLTGLSERDVLALPIDEYTRCAAAVHFLEVPCDLGGGKRIADRYTLGDLVLIPTRDYRKLTAGQFIDFQSLSGMDQADSLVPFLSVILVPEGHTYMDGYDVDALREAIAAYLSVEDAMQITAFFFTRLAASLRDSLTFSERAAKRMKGKKKEEVERNVKEARRLLRTVSEALGTGGGGLRM